MEKWTGAHCAFAIKAFKKIEIVLCMASLFFFFFSLHHLEIYPNNPMQSAHTIKTWVKNFEETGSALTKKRSGRIRIVGTPDNVAAV